MDVIYGINFGRPDIPTGYRKVLERAIREKTGYTKFNLVGASLTAVGLNYMKLVANNGNRRLHTIEIKHGLQEVFGLFEV